MNVHGPLTAWFLPSTRLSCFVQIICIIILSPNITLKCHEGKLILRMMGPLQLETAQYKISVQRSFLDFSLSYHRTSRQGDRLDGTFYDYLQILGLWEILLNCKHLQGRPSNLTLTHHHSLPLCHSAFLIYQLMQGDQGETLAWNSHQWMGL